MPTAWESNKEMPAWDQSDCSRMSATAASLKTIRGLFTGVEPVHEAC